MKKRILLGMSGGVDSSTSAILLKESGYEVVGVTMQLLDDDDGKAAYDAKKVCEKLDIEHHVIELKDEFREKVVNSFMCTYMCGKTPNPCVDCNKFIKFGLLFEYAKKLNCEYFATGHYAKTEYSEKYGKYVLRKAKEEKKDQSYFLYRINKEILPNIVFPLADFGSKEEIRKIAKQNGLEVAEKKDSQEICFIKDNDYVKFIKENFNDYKGKSGKIILKDGTILGEHTGIENYTVGQRKGLRSIL